MSELLARSMANYKTAYQARQLLTEDERLSNVICYGIQQAIGFALDYWAELYNPQINADASMVDWLPVLYEAGIVKTNKLEEALQMLDVWKATRVISTNITTITEYLDTLFKFYEELHSRLTPYQKVQ